MSVEKSTFQLRSTKEVLFSGAPYYAVQVGFVSVCGNEILKCDHSNAGAVYFPVVLFIMLYMVALTFESVNEIRFTVIFSSTDRDRYF